MELTQLKREVEKLHASTEALQSTTERLLLTLQDTVHQQGRVLNQTREGQSMIGWVVRFVGGAVVVLLVLVVYTNRSKGESKKFV
jgi:hypothetical protein